MGTYLTANVGDKGIFKFKSPISNVLTVKDSLNNKELTVIETIGLKTVGTSRGINDDDVVYDTIYKVLGLSRDDYDADLKDEKLVLITFKDDSGMTATIPNKYVETIPIVNGTRYTVMGMSVVLDRLPAKTDLDGAVKNVKELIKNMLGVTTLVSTHNLSTTTLLSTKEHDKLSKARDEIKKNDNYITTIEELKKSIAEYKSQILVLEQAYIDK